MADSCRSGGLNGLPGPEGPRSTRCSHSSQILEGLKSSGKQPFDICEQTGVFDQNVTHGLQIDMLLSVLCRMSGTHNRPTQPITQYHVTV